MGLADMAHILKETSTILRIVLVRGWLHHGKHLEKVAHKHLEESDQVSWLAFLALILSQCN